MQARQEELGILLVGADFVAAAAKTATYVLSIILVVGTKKSGRVTSPIQVKEHALQLYCPIIVVLSQLYNNETTTKLFYRLGLLTKSGMYRLPRLQ